MQKNRRYNDYYYEQEKRRRHIIAQKRQIHKKRRKRILFIKRVFFALRILIIIFVGVNMIHFIFPPVLAENNPVFNIEENHIYEQEIENTKEEPEEWKLILVNRDHPIPDGYKPELSMIEEGHQVDKRIKDQLNMMLKDAAEEGLSLVVCSSYRTNQKQEDLYSNKVQRLVYEGLSWDNARIEAGESVAYPGTSEHQVGLAIDIVSKSYQMLDEKQESTLEAQWLYQHCCEYGFILRYPKDKTDITKIIYEPWHYRYVGVKAAMYIMEHNICLEEYLELEF